MMLYKKLFFQVTIITLVLIASYPVSLLAEKNPKIKEKIFDKAEVQDFTAQNNKSHRYRFKICFDTKKNINGNNYTIELILHGKYVIYTSNDVSSQNQPEEYYSYDKKNHEFIHYKSFHKEECIIKESSRNYRIYIHDWTLPNFENIKVQAIDSSSKLPKDNIDFNTLNTDFVNKIVISYKPACNNINGECIPNIWSKKTCLDNYGFAYFSNQENIQCNELISLFHNKQPRVVQTIINQSINEDKRNMFHVPEGTFVDDDGDRLTYTATLKNGTTLPSWLIFNPTSSEFTAFPKNKDVGIHTIIVTASDEEAKAYTSFVITVQNINDPPVVKKKIVPKPAIEDIPYNFKLDKNTFQDIDKEDTLSYSVTYDPPDTWLTFNESAKEFSGTPANANVGNHTITVTVVDNDGASAYTSCVITVQNTNDAPEIRNVDIFNLPIEVFVNEPKNFTFNENIFSDEDKNDILRYSAFLEDNSPLPTWIEFDPEEIKFYCSPEEANKGVHKIKLTASDQLGKSVSALFTLKVKNYEVKNIFMPEPDPHTPHTPQPISETVIPKLTKDYITLKFNENIQKSHVINRKIFSDTKNSFKYEPNNLPGWLNFEINKESLTFSGKPEKEHVETKIIFLTVKEPQGLSISVPITIYVKNQNHKPTKKRNIEDINLKIDDTHVIYLDEYFQDKDSGDKLHYTVTRADNDEALPMWIYHDNGKVNIHPTGIIDIGTLPIKVIATDNQESSEPEFFTITVTEAPQIDPIEQPNEDDCSDDNLTTIEFSPNNQNDLISNTEDYIVVSIIKTKGLIHISKINCQILDDYPRCTFCSLIPRSSDFKADSFLWKKMGDSFDYVGKLEENDSILPGERFNLFAKPDPVNSKHLKCKDKRLNSFRMNFDAINNALPRIDQETKNIINDFFIIEQFEQFEQFYSTYSQQKNYQIQIFSGNPNFILLDDNTYFQRFNNCWSLKTFDYSTGTPIYIPIPERSLGAQYFNDVDHTNNQETQNEYRNVPVPENTAFRTTLHRNQNDKEYKYADAFGIVHLNMSFEMVNANENISSYIITSIVNNEIVFSPLFCERGLCKYYSPNSNDRNNTFVWSKQSGTYQFISSLPFIPGLRFSEMKSNYTPENQWLFDIFESFNQAINGNEATELCVYQNYSQRICIKDFFKQNAYSNFHRQNQYDNNIGDRYFKSNRNGDYIIFDDSYYLQKVGSYWHYKSFNDQIDKYIDFPNELVPSTPGSYTLFWCGKEDYHVWPIYHSQQNYYKIVSLNKYYIGYDNFKMAMDSINQSKSFTKWIIVDEYEDVDSNIMTKLFSPFRNNQLKDLIRQLSDKGKTYRFDGINGSYIRRLKTTEPDYASRKFAIFSNALTTIEPHSMNEKNTDWELHIFVPRNTSMSSFEISDKTYKKIINKLINLKVKGLCIWEFSNQKPLEKTPYENFIISLKNKHIPLLLKYKSIYNPEQFKEIMERFK